MAVLTFSTKFPSYHPKKGQPTFFVEKIWLWMVNVDGHSEPQYFPEYKDVVNIMDVLRQKPPSGKGHTIRKGHRWKVGDWFSPRIWGNDINPKNGKSGPYQSKQIIIAPDIQVKKVMTCEIKLVRDGILSAYEMFIDGKEIHVECSGIAENDGLSYNDFCDWFKMDNAKGDIFFSGQVICWNESIKY